MSNQNSKKVGRNTPCPCGSGKKYKKCCLQKDRDNRFLHFSRDTDNIISDLKYEITDNPIDDDEVGKLPTDVQDKLEKIYYKLHTNPQDCIKSLESLIKEYPLPRIYNYLSAAYVGAGKIAKANDIIKENYQKNPSYLFALLNYAELLIKAANYDEVEKIFNHKFDLKLLYPERNVFHITEVVSFFGVTGLYFSYTKQKEKALKCLNILEIIDPNSLYTKKLNMLESKHLKFSDFK